MTLSFRKAALIAATVSGLALGPPSAAQANEYVGLTVDQGGKATFVWEHQGLIEDRRRTYGGVLSDPEVLSPAAPKSAKHPDAAVDATGAVTYTWTHPDADGDYRIQTRRRLPDGTLTPIQTLSADGQHAWSPDVAVDGDGDGVFTWRRGLSATQSIVQARTQTAAGSLSTIYDVSVPSSGVRDPQVAVSPAGDAVFEWSRWPTATTEQIQGRSLSAGGQLGPVFDLSAPGATEAYDREVVVHWSGIATFLWSLKSSESSGGLKVQTRQLAADGTLTPTVNVSMASAGDADVALDGAGRATFTWSRYKGGTMVAQTRQRLSDGTLTPVIDISVPGERSHASDVVVDGKGNAVFLWGHTDSLDLESVRALRARTRSVGGNLGPAVELSAPGWSASWEHSAIDAQGNVTFAWQESSAVDGSLRVEGRRLTSTTGELGTAFQVFG